MSEETAVAKERTQDPGDRDHLEGVADGVGCAEIWEHLQAQRDENGE